MKTIKHLIIIFIACVSFIYVTYAETEGESLAVTDSKTGETQILRADPSQRQMLKTHSFLMKGGHEVMVYSEGFSSGTYIYLNQNIAYLLNPEHVISKYRISDDASTVVLMVDKSEGGSAGLWPRSLLVIRSIQVGEDYLITVTNTMDSNKLVRLMKGRHCDVLDILNVNNYPVVELEVGMSKHPIGTKTDREGGWFHQHWNVEKETLIKSKVSSRWRKEPPSFDPLDFVQR